MKNVLIVTSNPNEIEWFREDLVKVNIDDILTANSANEARRFFVSRTIDLLIINAPLTDENGLRLAVDMVGNKANQVIVFIKRESAEEVVAKVDKYGIFVVEKPASHFDFYSVLKIANASYNRLQSFILENERLKSSINNLKLINRAKCLLIEKLGLSEEEAHKQMEKQAMNMRIEKVELAKIIVEKYDN